MNIRELKELIDLLKDTEVAELEIERAGVRVRIRKGSMYPLPAAGPGGEIPPPPEGKREPATHPLVQRAEGGVGRKVLTITSPIVGMFYRSPSPEEAPYVEMGDSVKKGQTLCVIEAMKLMNEIESEADGRVTGILVENGQAVEYGEPLFLIEPLPEGH